MSGSRRGAGRREPAPEEVVVGRNAVLEALRAGLPARELVLADGPLRDPRLAEAAELAARRTLPVRRVGRDRLDRLGPVHQGAALRLRPFPYADPAALLTPTGRAGPALLVALDGITDPHNLGAIVRTAAAFGADGVLLPARRSAGMSPGAWKASAGAAARLPVARVTNLVRALATAAAAGLVVAGLDASGDVGLDAFAAASDPLVLVVGGEGRGLSRLVRERVDLTVRIPMVGAVGSLNASVAAAVALAEVARRRRVSSPGTARRPPA